MFVRCLKFLIISLFAVSYADSLQTAVIPVSNSNKIVAFVNKKIITEHELYLKLIEVEYNLQEQKITNPDKSNLIKQVLNEMIMHQVLLDNADRYGVKVTDSEISQALAKLLQDKKLTIDEFKNNLIKKQSSFDIFYKELKEEITIEKLTQKEISQKISVTNDEVMRIYNTQVYQNKQDFHLANITINIPENASSELISQKENLANNIYRRLQAKEDFNKLTMEYSEGSNALKAGDIGWRSSLSMPPVLFAQLQNMKPGDFTPVMKFADNFYIFKLLEIRQHNMPNLVKQYHVRHILIKVSEYSSEQEALDKISKLRSDILQNKEQKAINKAFGDSARSYSQDTSSINGGDIGWISTGDTVANFENSVIKAQLGEISQPVRTVFGWHIIQVIAVRNNDLRKDKEIADIKQELYQAKWQQNYQNWIELLKNSAYIKYVK